VIVPRIRVQGRLPGFKEKLLVVIGFKTNDPDICKVHVMAELVDSVWIFHLISIDFYDFISLLSPYSFRGDISRTQGSV